MEINTVEDLSKITHLLPTVALQDIEKRITDWIASGGDIEDDYIKQQCKYAERLIIQNQRR